MVVNKKQVSLHSLITGELKDFTAHFADNKVRSGTFHCCWGLTCGHLECHILCHKALTLKGTHMRNIFHTAQTLTQYNQGYKSTVISFCRAGLAWNWNFNHECPPLTGKQKEEAAVSGSNFLVISTQNATCCTPKIQTVTETWICIPALETEVLGGKWTPCTNLYVSSCLDYFCEQLIVVILWSSVSQSWLPCYGSDQNC